MPMNFNNNNNNTNINEKITQNIKIDPIVQKKEAIELCAKQFHDVKHRTNSENASYADKLNALLRDEYEKNNELGVDANIFTKLKMNLIERVSDNQNFWKIINELYNEEIFLYSILILFSLGIFFTLMWKYDIKIYVFYSAVVMIFFNILYYEELIMNQPETSIFFSTFFKIACVFWLFFMFALHIRWHIKNNAVEIILFKSLILFLSSLLLRFYNIISFLIILELISLLSFIIVGFENRNKHSILASARYLLLSFLPTVFLILWVLIIYKHTSSLSFSFLHQPRDPNPDFLNFDKELQDYEDFKQECWSIVLRNIDLTKGSQYHSLYSIYTYSFSDQYRLSEGNRAEFSRPVDDFKLMFYYNIYFQLVELYVSWYDLDRKRKILFESLIPYITSYEPKYRYLEKEEMLNLLNKLWEEKFENMETFDKILKICQENDKKRIA